MKNKMIKKRNSKKGFAINFILKAMKGGKV